MLIPSTILSTVIPTSSWDYFLGTRHSAPGFSVLMCKSPIIGSSDCNVYVPYSAFFCHERVAISNSDEHGVYEEHSVIQYSPYSHTIPFGTTRRYADFLAALTGGIEPKIFNYTYAGTPFKVIASRGMVQDNTGKVLFSIGITPDAMMRMFNNDNPLTRQFDSEDVVIIASRELEEEPKYKNLYKKIKSDYLHTMISTYGVDVIVTSDPSKWLYKNNFIMPKFKSIPDLNKYLKGLGKILTK